MARPRWLLGAGGLAALVLVWTVLAGFPFEGDMSAGERTGAPGPTVESATRNSSVEEVESPVRTADDAPGILAVRVRVGGNPAAGTAALVTGPAFPALYHSLACTFAPGAQDAQDVLHLDFRDALEVPVPAGHWSWLRLWEDSGGMRFLRVPPFRGRTEREVHLDPDRHILRVQVYHSDFRTPAGGSRVRLLASAIGDTTFGDEQAHVTDSIGHLELPGLDPGVYLLACGDAAPGDREPHVARVVLPPPGGREVLCTLVEPESRVEAVVEILGERVEGSTLAPKLFLRRVDDGSGRPFPQSGTLRDGHQVVRFSLPAGVYQPDVLPQLSVALEGHDGRLEVVQRGENRFRLLARRREEDIELRLVGPRLQHFPLRVLVQPVGGVRDDDPDIQFLGTLHWHAAMQRIPAARQPVLVIATGKRMSFISRGSVALDSDVVEAPMIQATEVVVVWFDWDPMRDAQPLVLVTAGGETVLRRLRPGLVPWFGGGRPAMTGSVVVPYGPIEIEYLHPTEGLVWRRHTRPTYTRTVVRIDGTRQGNAHRR